MAAIFVLLTQYQDCCVCHLYLKDVLCMLFYPTIQDHIYGQYAGHIKFLIKPQMAAQDPIEPNMAL